MMRCLTPELDGAAGLVAVEVSGNGADFSRDGVRYSVQEAPLILAVRPSMGPHTGGTAITVEREPGKVLLSDIAAEAAVLHPALSGGGFDLVAATTDQVCEAIL